MKHYVGVCAGILSLMVIPAGRPVHADVEITVTGKPMTVNGVESIPEALFGVHAGNFQGFDAATVSDWGIECSRVIQTGPGNPASAPSGVKHVVSCWYDRFQQALCLSRPTTWAATLESQAATFAAAAQSGTVVHHMEFWNEPYLNWAYKPGISYDPYWYDASGAVEGAPVRIKGVAASEPYMVWRKAVWFDAASWSDRARIYNAVSAAWNEQLTVKNIPYPGLEGALVPGEKYYAGTSREFTVVETLRPVDTTQKSYYSGAQNASYYTRMYKAAAAKLKALNPNVKLVAGAGFQPHIGDWAMWETWYKPLIDSCHELIDGINDHHYGTDTRIMAADYETIYAYMYSRYGRRPRFYNTETRGCIDPADRTSISGNCGVARKRFAYTARDVVYMASHCPDKAFCRAEHEPQGSNGGVAAAFKLYKDLRGRLVLTRSSSPDVWAAASINGSQLVVACFNDATASDSVRLVVRAPSGQTFTGGELTRSVVVGDSVALGRETVNASGATHTAGLRMEPLNGVCLTLDLAGAAGAGSPVEVNQFFGDKVLLRAGAGERVSATIAVPQADLDAARDARVKFVLMNYRGGGALRLNGQPLSFAYRGGDVYKGLGGLSYASVEPAILARSNTLEFDADTGAGSLWMASLELANAPGLVPAYDVSRGHTRGAPAVRHDMAGPRLVVSSTRTIVSVVLYRLDGTAVRSVQNAGSKATLDCDGIGAGPYLAVVDFREGRREAFRVVRHTYP